VVNSGRSLASLDPVAPKGGAHFHFNLPGAVQGFQAEDGSVRLERRVEMADALGGPLEQAHGVTLRVHERFQIGDQRRILRAQACPAPSRPRTRFPSTYACPSSISAIPLRMVLRVVRAARHLTDAATPNLLGFYREIYPPLPLIERSPHQVEGRWRLVLLHHVSIAQQFFTLSLHFSIMVK